MTEEKKKRTIRSKADIAADYKARVARIEWSGVKHALELVREAAKLLEEAEAACGGKVGIDGRTMWKDAQGALASIEQAIDAAIPPEAK